MRTINLSRSFVFALVVSAALGACGGEMVGQVPTKTTPAARNPAPAATSDTQRSPAPTTAHQTSEQPAPSAT